MEMESQRNNQKAANRLLELAAQIGNISEACRRLGLDRSVYYRLLKRADAEHRKTQKPQTGEPARSRGPASKALKAVLLRLCLEFPEWGCDRLAHYLTLTGNRISSPTVQKILIENGLGRAAQRMAAAKAQSDSGINGTQTPAP